MRYDNYISWKIEQGIGYLILNRPPGNVMTPFFFKELRKLTENVIPNSQIKAMIVSGKARHFSSGADLNSLLKIINEEVGMEKEKKYDKKYQLIRSNFRSFYFFNTLQIPVIASIQGICLGSALELAMYCHFRLCAKGAIFGLPEATYDLIPGIGGIQKLIFLTGKAKAIELVLKGNTFTADKAFQWGLIDAVFPKKDLMEKAVRLANLASENYRKYNKNDYLKML